jgi:uncharacterized protein DUF2846
MHTNRINWFIPVLIIAFLVSSCASTSKVSEDKSNAAKEFKTNSDKGIVYLYRPGRAVGAATQTQIKINGNSAGGTGPGTFFMWELEPGAYVFSCYTSESSAAVEIDVKPNENYFLRQDTRLGVGDGRVTLKKVDESTGKAGVKKCKMLQSTYIPSL